MAMAKRQTKKRASQAPELFNKSDFIVFSNYGGRKKENPENSKISSEYDRIKTKIKHLKAIIKSNLSSDYSFGGAVRSDSRAGKGQPLKYKKYIWLYIYNDKNSKIPKSEGGQLKDVPVNVYNLSFDKDGISICLDFKHGELPEELELPEENKKKKVIIYDGKSYNDLANEIVDYCRTHSDDYTNNYKIIEAHKQGELLQGPQSELNDNDETKPNGMKEPGTKKTDILKKWPMNLILYGPPGTGKTYNTVNKALEIVLNDDEASEVEKKVKEAENKVVENGFADDVEKQEAVAKARRKVFTDKFNELKNEGRIVFTTFHQSMSYEDFVEGIKPITNGEDVTYDVKPGIFKQICEKAHTDNGNNYVLIIDEINRGNVSQIFGELITLIEKDKRLGNKEELTAKLPYSSTCKETTAGKEEEFGVPNNLYIIGTMNTADRSVEALDTALRRRFAFEEVMPKYTNEEAHGIENKIKTKGGKEFQLSKILKTINQRIEVLKGRELQIGHSYLMKCKDEQDLKKAFKDKIVPLLQEYFYGDYSQIGLVLGKGFVNIVNEKVDFASGFETPEQNERRFCLLTDDEWEKIDMTTALNYLMNEKVSNEDQLQQSEQQESNAN